MSPEAVKSARQRLGLTQQGLAEALRLGPNGERTVRRWEQGDVPITGPASVAIELLLRFRDEFGRNDEELARATGEPLDFRYLMNAGKRDFKPPE